MATESGPLRSCSAKSHSLTTTSQLGSGDGRCIHRLKSCRQVPGVPFSSSAAHVGLWLVRFRDQFWTRLQSRPHTQSLRRFSSGGDPRRNTCEGINHEDDLD